MYFGSFQQLSFVNTGFPPSKVPIHRKLGLEHLLSELGRGMKQYLAIGQAVYLVLCVFCSWGRLRQHSQNRALNG